jgi:YVTN family beta-propeller protein
MGTRRILLPVAVVLPFVAAPWMGSQSQGQGRSPAARVGVRRPVAAAPLADGRTVAVANRRSGTVSVVDVQAGQVINEVAVGGTLADFAALPDRRHLLAVNEAKHELIALSSDGGRLTVDARLAVGPYPVCVVVSADGTWATVASLWSRKVEVIDCTPLTASTGAARMRVVHSIRLPFLPRLQCVLPGGTRVVVADAFGGHIAVVDAAGGRLVSDLELNGHNLRGLAVRADRGELLVAHQTLDQRAPTTEENIRRGALMANVLRRIPLDRLVAQPPLVEGADSVIRLGGVGASAGDPGGVAIAEDGRLAVALAGVHQVALLDADGRPGPRIGVGRRPTALVPGPGGQLIVVNTFDDSISVLDPRTAAVTRAISLGPAPPLDFKDRGELLFYDARLSRDGWMSCHSCHPDGHTNGLLADTLGDGTYGTPKRTLTLLNTRMTDPWGWNGGMKYLHDQVEHSLTETMHTTSAAGDHVGDLTTFIHSLPSPPPPEPVTADRADREQVERGQRVFEEHGCARCHIPPLTYSSHGTHDVGLEDERGLRKFNPPSLRGVGYGTRFLHDNRAASLAEVFTKFYHPDGGSIDGDELADLLRFLRSL